MTLWVIQSHADPSLGWDAYLHRWVPIEQATGFEFHAIAGLLAIQACGEDVFGWTIEPKTRVGSWWIGVAA